MWGAGDRRATGRGCHSDATTKHRPSPWVGNVAREEIQPYYPFRFMPRASARGMNPCYLLCFVKNKQNHLLILIIMYSKRTSTKGLFIRLFGFSFYKRFRPRVALYLPVSLSSVCLTFI